MVAPGTVALSLLPFTKKKDDTAAESSKLERIKREVDALYNAYLIENAYNALRRFATSHDTEMLWRLARALFEKSKISADKDRKRQYLQDALAISQKALQYEGEQGCADAHKWYAIILSSVAECDGIAEQVKKSLEVRHHLEKSLDLNTNDATTWHALGVWYFTYADFSIWKSLAAKASFVSPPIAAYEEALKYFEKSEFIRPNSSTSNLWYLAEVHSRLGNKEEAFKLYKQVFLMPVITMDDGHAHDKAYERLRKLGVTNFDNL